MQTGIYAIENLANGKAYIGSSVDLTKRMQNHQSMLRRNCHYNKHLQSAWNQYGENNFAFFPLIHCAETDITSTEQEVINTLDTVENGYNMAPVAGCQLGLQHSPETRLKMSIARKGKSHSPEWNLKISESNTGVKRTERTKERVRISKTHHMPDRPESCHVCNGHRIRSTGIKWHCKDCGKYWTKYKKRGIKHADNNL